MRLVRIPYIVEQLEALYGAPDPPDVTDPWEMIIWENVAYLVNDERRSEAMKTLQTRVGLSADQILSATSEQLLPAAACGIVPEQSVQKLRRCASIALEEFSGDLQPILRLPLAQAKKALKRFPAIGDPGAEKILLFARAYPILALDSNGLRVLVRLGFAEESANYAKTYRQVQEAVREDIVKEHSWLIKAHQLLRRHGQELCKRSKPHCENCPLSSECPWPVANRQFGGG
jgi:endonuclease III